jgi:hypothetical protein
MIKGKGKVIPVLNKAPRRRTEDWRYRSTHSLTSALDRGERSASHPGHIILKERGPGTHWIGNWGGGDQG